MIRVNRLQASFHLSWNVSIIFWRFVLREGLTVCWRRLLTVWSWKFTLTLGQTGFKDFQQTALPLTISSEASELFWQSSDTCRSNVTSIVKAEVNLCISRNYFLSKLLHRKCKAACINGKRLANWTNEAWANMITVWPLTATVHTGGWIDGGSLVPHFNIIDFLIPSCQT